MFILGRGSVCCKLSAKYMCIEKPTGEDTLRVMALENPNSKHLSVIGTKACVLDRTAKGKFGAPARDGVLFGYSDVSKGYRLWIPAENSVVRARDVKFKLELGETDSRRENLNT